MQERRFGITNRKAIDKREEVGYNKDKYRRHAKRSGLQSIEEEKMRRKRLERGKTVATA